MDGTGNFGAARDELEAGIETPINIGNDERRMHVRAYNYWVSLLDGRAYPSIEDLNPEELEDFGPNSILLDFTSGIENPGIGWLGDRLRVACDLPTGLTSVDDIPTRSILSRLTDHYMQIIANRAPIGFEAEYINDRGTEIMYRGILMPFSSDDDTIDFIYGVINWKEAADAATNQLLVDQVQRVLDSAVPQAEPVNEKKPALWPEAPAVREEPRVQAWADGPSADAAPGFSIATAFDGVDFDGVEGAEEKIAAAPVVVENTGNEALADWLAAARISADAATQADQRSRVALYRALGMAYDFGLAADEHAGEYAELLGDAGIEPQARAPMTPIVKLVFGIGHDKTRLAEYAAALTHGKRANVARGGFQSFVEGYAGALKGVVNAERALRKPADKAKPDSTQFVERARTIAPRGIVEMAGDEEFVMLVARRIDGQHVAVIGHLPNDDKLMEKALRHIAG
jgi:hypothetical protein